MQNPNNASSPTDQEQNEASGTKPNDLLKTAAVVAGLGIGAALLLRSLGKQAERQQATDGGNGKVQDPELQAIMERQKANEISRWVTESEKMWHETAKNTCRNV